MDAIKSRQNPTAKSPEAKEVIGGGKCKGCSSGSCEGCFVQRIRDLQAARQEGDAAKEKEAKAKLGLATGAPEQVQAQQAPNPIPIAAAPKAATFKVPTASTQQQSRVAPSAPAISAAPQFSKPKISVPVAQRKVESPDVSARTTQQAATYNAPKTQTRGPEIRSSAQPIADKKKEGAAIPQHATSSTRTAQEFRAKQPEIKDAAQQSVRTYTAKTQTNSTSTAAAELNFASPRSYERHETKSETNSTSQSQTKPYSFRSTQTSTIRQPAVREVIKNQAASQVINSRQVFEVRQAEVRTTTQNSAAQIARQMTRPIQVIKETILPKGFVTEKTQGSVKAPRLIPQIIMSINSTHQKTSSLKVEHGEVKVAVIIRHTQSATRTVSPAVRAVITNIQENRRQVMTVRSMDKGTETVRQESTASNYAVPINFRQRSPVPINKAGPVAKFKDDSGFNPIRMAARASQVKNPVSVARVDAMREETMPRSERTVSLQIRQQPILLSERPTQMIFSPLSTVVIAIGRTQRFSIEQEAEEYPAIGNYGVVNLTIYIGERVKSSTTGEKLKEFSDCCVHYGYAKVWSFSERPEGGQMGVSFKGDMSKLDQELLPLLQEYGNYLVGEGMCSSFSLAKRIPSSMATA